MIICLLVKDIEVILLQGNHTTTSITVDVFSCFRQDLIDRFNREQDIFIFLLSTKAGKVHVLLWLCNVNG